MTELTRDDPAAGNVAFWYRDLERAENDGDSGPHAVVHYRPHGRNAPTVRLHDHTPEPEVTARIGFLGEMGRAMRSSDRKEGKGG